MWRTHRFPFQYTFTYDICQGTFDINTNYVSIPPDPLPNLSR